jgi:hypothetical protein
MSRKVTCCTIIKSVLLIHFFFANQTIMFFKIVFSSVGECKGVFVISVSSYEWKCCTFKIQGEITSSAYKYPPCWHIGILYHKHCIFYQNLRKERVSVGDLHVSGFLELNNIEHPYQKSTCRNYR